MSVSQQQILDIASDWSLDGNEFRSAMGRALVALDDAMQSYEAQNDAEITAALTEITKDLFELVGDEES